jgi:hypothetical protein
MLKGEFVASYRSVRLFHSVFFRKVSTRKKDPTEEEEDARFPEILFAGYGLGVLCRVHPSGHLSANSEQYPGKK